MRSLQTDFRGSHVKASRLARLYESVSAVARVGCCSTFRETVAGNFLKKFHKTDRVTRCNFRRNLFRVAVSRKKFHRVTYMSEKSHAPNRVLNFGSWSVTRNLVPASSLRQ